MLDSSVVVRYADSSQRVFYGTYPLGRKLQTKGHRCSDEHDFYEDRYPGARHEYVDLVCRNCTRRKPVR